MCFSETSPHCSVYPCLSCSSQRFASFVITIRVNRFFQVWKYFYELVWDLFSLVPNMKKRNQKGQRWKTSQELQTLSPTVPVVSLSLRLKARFVWKLFVLRNILPRKFYGVEEKYFQRSLKQFAEAIVQK